MKWFLSEACQRICESLSNGKSNRQIDLAMTNNCYDSKEKTDQFKDEDEAITIWKMETSWYEDRDKSVAMQYIKTNQFQGGGKSMPGLRTDVSQLGRWSQTNSKTKTKQPQVK
jgi:hypothetical protein